MAARRPPPRVPAPLSCDRQIRLSRTCQAVWPPRSSSGRLPLSATRNPPAASRRVRREAGRRRGRGSTGRPGGDGGSAGPQQPTWDADRRSGRAERLSGESRRLKQRGTEEPPAAGVPVGGHHRRDRRRRRLLLRCHRRHDYGEGSVSLPCSGWRIPWTASRKASVPDRLRLSLRVAPMALVNRQATCAVTRSQREGPPGGSADREGRHGADQDHSAEPFSVLGEAGRLPGQGARKD